MKNEIVWTISSVANIDRRIIFWWANVTPLRTYVATSLIARPTSHFRRYIRASGDEWTGTGSESYAMINEWPHGTSASPAHLDEADSHQPRMGERMIVFVRVWRPPWKWLRHHWMNHVGERKNAPSPNRSARFNCIFVIINQTFAFIKCTLAELRL